MAVSLTARCMSSTMEALATSQSIAKAICTHRELATATRPWASIVITQAKALAVKHYCLTSSHS